MSASATIPKPYRPTGKVVRLRRCDPLPAIASAHLLGGDPFGAFSKSNVRTIHADEQWYGDGVPTWPEAPSAADACAMRVKAADRLDHPAYISVVGASALALLIASCSPDSRCHSHACFECGRTAQKWLVRAVGTVLKTDDAGCKDWSFNFVMPDGQVAIADLGNAPFTMILQRVRAALEKCRAVEFAVLGLDISANDDTEKFRRGRLKDGPRIYWQIHVYGIVRTRSKKAVWKSLRHLFPKAANIYRPLSMSRKPFDGAAKGISYILKPQGFRHVPYFDEARGEWNTPKKPKALLAREHVFYMLAMHRLGLKNRIAFVGLHPEITKATKTRNRGVRLRRVFRRRSAM